MRRSQRLLAGFWLVAGVNHFLVPRQYEAIMPPYVPAHREMVQLSGVAEIVAGAAVIPDATRRPFARWWILGVLAAVFPANLHMALNPDQFPKIPRWALYVRLPIQLLFALWAWRATED